MKLKRCPNLHYYDGDRYEQCPHCGAASAPAPAPEPKPEAKPEPKPEAKPEPKPEIKPEPVFVPNVPEEMPDRRPDTVQEPVPAPQPVSAPVSQEGESWRCECGAVNKASGKFCVQCGAKRPDAEPEAPAEREPSAGEWKCRFCGAVNRGAFCCECGARNMEADDGPDPVPPGLIPGKAAEEKPVYTAAENLKQEPAAPEVKPEPEEKSVEEEISEIGFTGNIEDAAKQTAPAGTDDEGVTQLLSDMPEEGLVLGWLVAANTEIKGKVFTLTDSRVTVGRGDAEHLVTVDLHGDRTVSRGAQAEIVYDARNRLFMIREAGGKTDVYLNGRLLLAPAELSAGDIIGLGATELVFVPLCCEKFAW